MTDDPLFNGRCGRARANSILTRSFRDARMQLELHQSELHDDNLEMLNFYIVSVSVCLPTGVESSPSVPYTAI